MEPPEAVARCEKGAWMMKVRVVSTLGSLAWEVAGWLAEHGFAQVEAAREDRGFALLHGGGRSPHELIALQHRLRPFAPPLRTDPALRGRDEVLLSLSPGPEEGRCTVVVEGESDAVVESLCEALVRCGYEARSGRTCFPRHDTLYTPDPTSAPARLLRWLLRMRGIDVRFVVDRFSFSRELRLVVRDPAREPLDSLERLPLEVWTDAPEQAAGLEAALGEAGITTVAWRVVDDPGPTFRLDPGPWRWLDGGRPAIVATLTLRRYLAALGVSPAFPLHVDEGDERGDAPPRACLHLPFGRWRDGLLRGTGRGRPECYRVHLFTDDRDRTGPLYDDLVEAGFVLPRIRYLPSTAVRRGFRLQWGALEADTAIRTTLLDIVQAHLATLKGGDIFTVRGWQKFGPHDHDVYIWFPAAAVEEGTLLAQVCDLASYRLTLCTDDPATAEPLQVELATWGFGRCAIRHGGVEADLIEYGGAPRDLVARLAALLEVRTRGSYRLHRVWSEDDTEIRVHLPW